jgi:hypothetical protein
MGKRLSSIEGGDETVAVININATAGGDKAGKAYEVSSQPAACYDYYCVAASAIDPAARVCYK